MLQALLKYPKILENEAGKRQGLLCGETALICVIYRRNVAAAKLPAQYDAGLEDIGAIKLLTRYEAGLQDKDGKTALMHVMMCHDSTALQALIEVLSWSPAELTRVVRLQDRDRKTALMYAIDRKNIAAIERLAQYDAGLQDKDDKTALMHAAKCGHTGVARILVAQTVAVGMQDSSRLTDLVLAAQKGRLNVTRLLLKKRGWDERQSRMYSFDVCCTRRS